ncbi:MAG: FAD-dependent monooxygenase [Bacteroidota bacterium]
MTHVYFCHPGGSVADCKQGRPGSPENDVTSFPNCENTMIDIIGGGIGGLTTAVALEQRGILYRIYEQAAELRPVGAGIILANNAMQVYGKLGLKAEIEAAGNPISFLNVTTPSLQAISKVDLQYFEEKYGVKNTAVHRGELQEILLQQIDPDSLYLDHKLQSATSSGMGFQLLFENDHEVFSETLIGADGIHSRVREGLFQPIQLRSSGQTCWRGLTDFDLPTAYQRELNEAWGAGIRFGFVQIAKGKVYWYAVKSMEKGEHIPLEELTSYYQAFHPMIQEIITQTPLDKIHTATLDDLKPFAPWWKAHVCLLGDAAHATTPNMGQGACQAIEDAYILADCLHHHSDPNEAFSNFQQLRQAKAHLVVNRSWQIGKMAHWKNPLAIGMRNLLMRSMPASLNRKQSERIFELAYSPSITYS